MVVRITEDAEDTEITEFIMVRVAPDLCAVRSGPFVLHYSLVGSGMCFRAAELMQ